MSETDIQALSSRLKELETKLVQSAATGGVGGATAAASPPLRKVNIPRERKLRKYNGARDDKILEDWIANATRAVKGQADTDAVDFLAYHLEGPAKDEVRLRPSEEWSTPENLFKVLRASFGEQLTATQALRKFFERQQQERESVQDFAHALMVLQARVERLEPSATAEKDKLLRDQFLENLRDSSLRRDVKRWARDHPNKSFNEVRDEVQRWVNEDCTPGRRAGVREAVAILEEATCEELRGQSTQKAISELQTQQATLLGQVEQQGKILLQQQQMIEGLVSRLEKAAKPRGQCYHCGSPDHYRNRCPERKRGGAHEPASNSQQSNSRAPRD